MVAPIWNLAHSAGGKLELKYIVLGIYSSITKVMINVRVFPKKLRNIFAKEIAVKYDFKIINSYVCV